jgi:hypothetical protein
MSEHPRDAEPAFDALKLEDATALDALVESGFDANSAMRFVPNGRERVEQLQNLLSLLHCGATSDRSLADVTFARLMQLRGQKLGAPAPSEPALAPDDDAALERLVMAGFDSSRVPSALRERARRHEALAGLVTATATPYASASLVDRTLAKVQAHIETESAAMRFQAAPRRRGFGIRISELASAAAVLLIGAGVLLPVLSALREQARQSMCKANLGNTALAMSSYASSNRDSLPVATASLDGGKWWDVGHPRQDGRLQSNSANLFTLTHDGYEKLQALACPGNPRAACTAPPGARDWSCLEEVSYSYQIMFGPQRAAWRQGNTVVVADRSPIVARSIRREPFDPFANSLNHQGAGEHILYNDGNVTWAPSPILANGDNIWLPHQIEIVISHFAVRPRQMAPLQGTEMPSAADDAFVGP